MPKDEFEYHQIKKLAGRGITALVSRTFLIQIISFAAMATLTYILDPAIYGVFYLVSAVINFLAYFSDIGLAAALVQKKADLNDDDLSTTFTIQQGLVLLLLTILFLSTPFIRRTYGLDSAGVYLLWSLGISLFLSSLKTVPSVLLERKIQFEKLIIPQIGETLVFNACLVYFAWKGYGLTTFTISVLARGIVGLVLMYLVAPWKPRIKISKNSLRHLLKFGLPYQLNSFLAVFKDDGMTIVLGKIIGSGGLGYLGWGSRWAGLPLRIFMDNVTKVAFPTFARLQHNKEKLITAIEQTLKYLALATFPVLIGMGFLAYPIILIIPNYTKWLPALIPLYIYLYNAAWACISTVLTNTLNALGKIKSTFKLMLIWTGLTWGTMPILGIKFGYMGVAVAVGIIATSSVLTLIMVYREVKVNFFRSLGKPLLINFIFGLYLFLTAKYIDSKLEIFACIFLSIPIYAGLVYWLEGKDIYTKAISVLRPRV